MTETLKLWEFLIGLASIFVGVGVFYEHTKSKFREYDKAFASCHIDTLMTEEKCLRYHTDRDRLVQLQIAQMQKVVEALEAAQKADDQRWGGLSEKINIIIDRMDRGTGYAK
jgi:hypothetical protein